MAATRERYLYIQIGKYSNAPIPRSPLSIKKKLSSNNPWNVRILLFGVPIRIWLLNVCEGPMWAAFFFFCFFFIRLWAKERGDMAARCGDGWREGLIKLVFCGGRTLTSGWVMRRGHCSLNNGRFRSAIVSIVETIRIWSNMPPVHDKIIQDSASLMLPKTCIYLLSVLLGMF